MWNKRCAMSGEVDRENCGADSGLTVSRARTLGKALLLLAAAAALLFGGGLAAQAQVDENSSECSTDDTTLTCTGDLSAGVDLDDDTYTKLEVKDLDDDTNITPPENTHGINFATNSNIEIIVDALGHSIMTSSSQNREAIGIRARSDGGGDVTVNVNIDDITTTGDDSEGIEAFSNNGRGDITIDMTGNITTGTSGSEGIDARGDGGGDMKIDMTGDITTMGDEDSEGIFARSNSGGDIEVTMRGDITTSGGCETAGETDANCSEGIKARSRGDEGHVTVTVLDGMDGSNIKTSGDGSDGINAESAGSGAVTVDVTGDITTMGNQDSKGIDARGRGNFAVMVDVTGDITTNGTNSDGIQARSYNSGAVTVNMKGDITTFGACSDENDSNSCSDGIFARADTGNIGITLNGGTITSDQGVGVRFVDGSALNTLTISEGAAVTISGAGFDVLGGSGDETIKNYGTLTTPGRIRLGGGTNAFNNMAGATFHSGDSVGLGINGILANEGDLSPGGADVVQTTTLIGNFVNKKEGTFTVTIDPETETSDQLSVNGTATLEGGTVKVIGRHYGIYTILEATKVEGTFDDLATDTLFIDNRLRYDTTTVEFSSTRNSLRFRDFAGTANQLAVAKVLDSLERTNISHPFVQAGRARTTTAEAQAASNGNNPIVKAVLALTTTAGAQAAYDNLSGEVHASLKGALMDTGQRPVAAVHRRLTARGRQPDARTSTATVGDLSSRADDQTGFWMIGYDAWSDTKGTSNTAQMDTDLGGGLFGMDRALGKHGHVGILGGYSQTSVAQQARISSGSVETWSVGLYGGAEAGASRLRVGALYNGHSVTTRRTVGFTGYSLERLSARYDAWSWQVFGEAGYQLQVRELLLEPFAGVSHISLETDGFSETGGIAALTASSDTNSRTLTTLGVRSAMELKAMIQARGMVGWRHAFGDTDPSSTHTLANIATDTTLGAPTAEDAVVTELGLEVGLSAHAVLGVAYQGQYGDGVTVHGFNAGLKLTF